MSGKGPVPKARRTRPRDDKPEMVLIPADATEHPMPDGDYLPATIAWWETWANSEQAQHFIATDWGRLTMLLEIVDLFFREPSKELLGEIRLNEAKLGGTPEDRMRLRWKLEKPPPPPSSKGMFDAIMRPVESPRSAPSSRSRSRRRCRRLAREIGRSS